MNGPCPCGSGASYAGCCGRYHAGQALPADAVALMRSRYAAFATGDTGYLLETWHPNTRPPRLDLEQGLVWTALEILHCQAGTDDDDEGKVEFKAHWHGGGHRGFLHETSRFLKWDGRWYYLDGQIHPQSSAKVGRNEPCPCGSGKKFKYCCGR